MKSKLANLRQEVFRWARLNFPRLMRKATTAAYCGVTGFLILLIGLAWAGSSWMPSGLVGWTIRAVVAIGSLVIGSILLMISICYWFEGNPIMPAKYAGAFWTCEDCGLRSQQTRNYCASCGSNKLRKS